MVKRYSFQHYETPYLAKALDVNVNQDFVVHEEKGLRKVNGKGVLEVLASGKTYEASQKDIIKLLEGRAKIDEKEESSSKLLNELLALYQFAGIRWLTKLKDQQTVSAWQGEKPKLSDGELFYISLGAEIKLPKETETFRVVKEGEVFDIENFLTQKNK